MYWKIHYLIILILVRFKPIFSSWDDWWTYDGISGPDFWGLLNPEWTICNKGKHQSPVNIVTTQLLYDGELKPIQVDTHKTNAILENDGHAVFIRAQDSKSVNHNRAANLRVSLRGGPFSYVYTFSYLKISFGLHNSAGSEHQLNGHPFQAEMQIMFFNSDLYANFEQATKSPNGLAGIIMIIQLGNTTSNELDFIVTQLKQIKHRGQNVPLSDFVLSHFILERSDYVTYEGSLTTPPCFETVTWLLINKPFKLNSKDLNSLRELTQGERDQPKAPLGNNFRHPQPLHSRVLRSSMRRRSCSIP